MQIQTAKSFDGLVPLDINNPATWRNSPAPAVDAAIQAELTRIGGLIPDGNGQYSGEPVLKLVWGQSETFYSIAPDRLRFQDQRIPIQAPHMLRYRAFAVRREHLSRINEWIRQKEQEKREAFLKCDFRGAAKPYRIAEFLQSEITTLDWYALDASRDANTHDLIALGTLLPATHAIIFDGFDYLPVGKQCFYVVQWLPAKAMCTPENWADNRYGMSYVPETNSDQFVDILGEYPQHGEYSHPVLQIADNINGLDYEYAEPTYANTIEPIREMWQSRERASCEEKHSSFTIWAREEKARMEHRREKDCRVVQDIANDALPVGKGNPTSVPTTKLTAR